MADRVHSENAEMDSRIQTGGKSNTDPFTLTPLRLESTLDDITPDPTRTFGDELLLFQISAQNFTQSQNGVMTPERFTFENGFVASMSILPGRVSYSEGASSWGVVEENETATQSAAVGGGYQLMYSTFYTDVTNDPAYHPIGIPVVPHSNKVYDWSLPADGQQVFWGGTMPSWVMSTGELGFFGTATLTYYRNGTHANDDTGWTSFGMYPSLISDGHNICVAAFPGYGYYDIKVVHNGSPTIVNDVYYCEIKNIEWVVRAASPDTNGHDFGQLDKPNGNHRIFPEKPNPSATNCNEAELKVTINPAIGNGAVGELSLALFDPANQQLLNSNLDHPDGNGKKMGVPDDNFGGIGASLNTTTLTFSNGASVSSVYLTVDQANAGNNWVVGISPVASILGDARVSETGTKSTLEMTPVTNRVYQQVLFLSAMLTTWRTLWMELDRMAAPSMTVDDGFDPAKQYGGAIPNPPISGFWGTAVPSPEPTDFDLFFQPPKPDISLLTSAMVAACITVREVTQGADGTTNATWITGDSASTNPNEWDNTTPFVHNRQTTFASSAVAISDPSRDVKKNTPEFWCIHAIGAYEYIVANDGDSIGEHYTLGTATRSASAIVMIYNEAIRDRIQVTGNGYVAAARNETEIRQLVAYHETLHMFGFADNIADGPIMVSGWITASTLSLEVTTLSDAQIKKVQERDYPH